MLKRRSFKRPRSKIFKPRNCIFCQGTNLDWKDAAVLKKFVSERGKILSRLKSGNCAYHQRRLAQAIKRARHVALIPFKSSI